MASCRLECTAQFEWKNTGEKNERILRAKDKNESHQQQEWQQQNGGGTKSSSNKQQQEKVDKIV